MKFAGLESLFAAHLSQSLQSSKEQGGTYGYVGRSKI